jgi:hypothetical protein
VSKRKADASTREHFVDASLPSDGSSRFSASRDGTIEPLINNR